MRSISKSLTNVSQYSVFVTPNCLLFYLIKVGLKTDFNSDQQMFPEILFQWCIHRIIDFQKVTTHKHGICMGRRAQKWVFYVNYLAYFGNDSKNSCIYPRGVAAIGNFSGVILKIIMDVFVK